MTLSTSAVFILAIAALVGIVLGLVFYGGLYWTVSRGLSSKHPALWFLFSLLVRVSIVLAGFYFVSSYPIQGSSIPSLSISAHLISAPALPHSTEPVLQMERLISSLVAFTITGLIIRWFTRPSKLLTLPQLSKAVDQSCLAESSGLAESSSLAESSLDDSSKEASHAPNS